MSENFKTSGLLMLITLFSVCIFWGCVSTIPMKEVGYINDVIGQNSDLKKKPTVFLDLTSIEGPSETKLKQTYTSQSYFELAYKLTQETNLFSGILTEEYERDKANYIMKVEIASYSYNRTAAVARACLSGLSLGLIPSYEKFIIRVKTEVIDKKGKTVYEYVNKDSYEYRFGCLVFPTAASGHRIDAKPYTVFNLFKDSLKNLSRSESFKTSVNDTLK